MISTLLHILNKFKIHKIVNVFLKKVTWIDWLAVSIILLTPLTWFGWSVSHIIVGEDLIFFLKPPHDAGYVWDDSFGPGRYSNRNIFYIPYFTALKLLNLLLPLQIVEMLLIYFFIGICFLGFRLLIVEIHKIDCGGSILSFQKIAALCSLLYTFNPYTLFEWYMGNSTSIFFHSLLPISLYLYIRGIYSSYHKNRIKISSWTILAALIGFFISAPPFIVPWFVIIFSFTVLLILLNTKNTRLFLKNFLVYIIIYVGVGAYWLVPFLVSIRSNISQYISTTHSISIFLRFNQHSQLAEIFRLLGYGNFYSGTIPASSFYFEPSITFFSYALTGLAFASLMLPSKRNKSRKKILFMTFLCILITFVMKGPNPPFASVNIWAFQNVLFLRMLRVPWRHLMPIYMLCLITLLSFTVKGLMHKIKGDLGRNFIVGALVIGIVIYTCPVSSGAIFSSHAYLDYRGQVKVTQPYYVDIPWYYYKAAEYIRNDSSSFSIMMLPFGTVAASFKWGFMGSQGFLSWFFDKPIVPGDMGADVELKNFFVNLINELYGMPNPSIPKFLYERFNNKYVLVLHDWDMEFVEYLGTPRLTPDEIGIVLKKAGFVYETRIGEISIYRNPYWKKSNDVYLLLSDDNLMAQFSQPGPDLVLWLRFENVNMIAQDSSLYQNHGMVVNLSNQSSSWLDSGVSGKAVRLMSSYIIIPHHSSLNLKNFTIETWFKLDSKPLGHVAVIDKWPKTFRILVRDLTQPHGIYGEVFFEGNESAWNSLDAYSWIKPETDRWYHVALRYDGQNLCLFVNGQLVRQVSSSGKVSATNNSPLTIGASLDHGAAKYLLNGSIDEVRIYNRPLGWLEIRQHYLQGIAEMNKTNGELSVLYHSIQTSHSNENKAEMAYQKRNPVKYVINITDYGNYSYLILNKRYDPNWQIYEGEVNWFEALFRPPLKVNHYSIEGMANAWMIEKVEAKQLTIYYTLQSYHILGGIISITTVVATLILSLNKYKLHMFSRNNK